MPGQGEARQPTGSVMEDLQQGKVVLRVMVRVMVRSLFRAGVGVFQSYGQGHAWPGPWSDLYPAYDHGHGLD